MKLDEEVITLLGFGEYWGDSGESGTRYLSDPDRPGYSLMRIHEIDASEAGNHYGYGWEEAQSISYTTDDFRTTLETVEELLEDAKSDKWKPEAYELLMKNAQEHHLIQPHTS